MTSHGLKASEIAGEGLQLPESLARRWHARGYYGTVSHNVKAIVQRYLSWYDAHPANLHALPPVAAAARKRLEYMGGIEAVMARAARRLRARRVPLGGGGAQARGVLRIPTMLQHASWRPGRWSRCGFPRPESTWRSAYLLAARAVPARRPAPSQSAGGRRPTP
ncbi:alkyl sulfatase dimerization domain-containing protein [Cupriavidus basilensis]